MRIFSILILLLLTTVQTKAQYNNSIHSFELNGKKGYVDANLNVLIKPIYDDLGGFKEKFLGNYSIFGLNGKYGVLDLKGNHIIPPKYEHLRNTGSSDIFIFGKGKKYGLVDIKGKEILAATYGYGVRLIANGKSIIVEKDNKYALLDKNGKHISKFEYDYIDGDFNSKISIFKRDKKYGYLNQKGKEIIKPTYSVAYKFKDGYAIVKIEDKWGIINEKGTLVSPVAYDKISYQYSFYHDHEIALKTKIYYIKKNKKIGILDAKHKVVVSPMYDEIGDFSEGLAFVRKDNKYGFINEKGSIVIPLMYEDADSFSEGLAPVIKNGKWGYVNIQNEIKIDFKFVGTVKPFQNGLAMYRKRNFKSSRAHYVGDKCGYIDVNGNIAIKPMYRGASKFINGIAKVEDKKSVYLINKENKRFVLKSSDVEIMEVESN